jgi:hypothetical protein
MDRRNFDAGLPLMDAVAQGKMNARNTQLRIEADCAAKGRPTKAAKFRAKCR